MLRFAASTVLATFGLAWSAQAALASPQPKIIGFGPDLIIVLSQEPVRDKKSGVLQGAVLQGEVVSEASAAASGWRSMRATFDIFCASHADRVRAMTVFSQHNGLGEAVALTPPPGWIAVGQNTSYGLAVVKYFCGDGAASAAALSKPVEDKPRDDSISQPPVTEDAQSNADQSSTAASPISSASDNNNSNGGVASADLGTTPYVRLPSPTPKATLHSTGKGAFAVQLGSTTVQAEAQAALAKLKFSNAEALESLGTRIEAADVMGARHYRIIVFGFSDAASAARFCTKFRAANGCLIRRGT